MRVIRDITIIIVSLIALSACDVSFLLPENDDFEPPLWLRGRWIHEDGSWIEITDDNITGEIVEITDNGINEEIKRVRFNIADYVSKKGVDIVTGGVYDGDYSLFFSDTTSNPNKISQISIKDRSPGITVFLYTEERLDTELYLKIFD